MNCLPRPSAQSRNLILTVLFSLVFLVSCGSDEPVAPTPTANRAPDTPVINTAVGSPADAATDISAAAVLHWTCTDPDGDDLAFTVHFGPADPPPAVSHDQSLSSFDPSLDHEATYYWQIVATDPDGETATSAVWSFTTGAPVPETISQPDIPTGPATGFATGELDFVASGAVSSFGWNVQYRCDWGDGSQSSWSSATDFSHTWTTPGTYDVTTQARSSVTAAIESSWSAALTVVIDPVPETINMGFGFSGEWTIGAGESHAYSLSQLPVSSEGHPIEIQIVWGDGTTTDWMTGLAASHAWSTEGQYEVGVVARCVLHPTITAERLAIRTIAVAASETVAVPSSISGIGGSNASSVEYTISSHSTSSFGHAVEIQYDFGDGSAFTDWVPSGDFVRHTWAAGTYVVTARARCVDHPDIISAWGGTENATFAEMIYSGAISGPGTGIAGQPVTFTTTEATSTEGHPIEYQFIYTSFNVLYESGWGDELSGDIIFPNAGQYRVHVQSRCALHPEVTARDFAGAFTVILAP